MRTAFLILICLVALTPILSRADTPAAPSQSPLIQYLMGPMGHLGLAKNAGSQDPIGSIAGQMQVISTDLGNQKTDVPVQDQQRQVVASLDDIIKQLEKQTSGSGKSKSANPSSPMRSSTLTGGPGGSGPLHDPAAGTKDWAQLPPKERDEILQSQTEGFPPGYDAVLANYYNRLAQGQATGDQAPAPSTQPSNP